jgi:hypothetical protein
VFYEEDGTVEWLNVREEAMLIELGVAMVKTWPVTVYGTTPAAKAYLATMPGHKKASAGGQ